MSLQLLYTPKDSQSMQVIGFMSGSGTNLVKIIEWEKKLDAEKGRSPYHVSLIFTDNKESNAGLISEKFDLPLEIFDILDFYKSKGHSNKKDLSLRGEFDKQAIEKLKNHRIDIIALAGYMSIVTQPLLDSFPARIINVHPADLSVKTGDKRKYTGAHSVRDAILAGERELRSTTHIVRKEVDYGEILIASSGLPVDLSDGLTPEDLAKTENKKRLEEISSEYQDKLKEMGDWKIFPLTLQYIAEGRFGIDGKGNVFFDNQIRQNGYRL